MPEAPMEGTSIYDGILRRGYRVAHILRCLYWRLWRPAVIGVRVLVRTEDDCLILVEHSYEKGVFYLPGGRLAREHCADGALRELYEETGIKAKRGVAGLRLLTVFTHFSHGKTDHTLVYELPPEEWTVPPALGPDRRFEILRVIVAPIKDLPNGISPCALDSVRAFLKKSAPA